MKKKSNSKFPKSFLTFLTRWVLLDQRKTKSGKKLKSDVFKAFLILRGRIKGHFGIFGGFFVIKNLQFQF